MLQALVPTLVLPRKAAAAGFQGIGDVVAAGLIEYWGLRAANNAWALANATSVALRRDSDNAIQGFAVLSNGDLDVASIASFKGAANLFVQSLRGQTQGKDLNQATAANQPALILNGLGTKPVIRFTASSSMQFGSATGSVSAPYSFVTAANQSTRGTQHCLVADNTSIALGYENSGANTMFILGGAVLNVACASSTWHALSMVISSTASADVAAVDATQTTGNAGSNGIVTGLSIGAFNNSQFFQGDFTELALYQVTLTPAQMTNMNSNIHAYWGF